MNVLVRVADYATGNVRCIAGELSSCVVSKRWWDIFGRRTCL